MMLEKYRAGVTYIACLLIWVPRRLIEVIWSTRVCRSYKAFTNFLDYPGFMRRGEAFRFVLDDFYASVGPFETGLNIGSGPIFIEGLRSVDMIFGHSVYDLPCADSSQDVVFCSHCLEHVDAEDRFFREVLRVLKGGGLAYFYVPHEVCSMWATDNLPYHFRVYNSQSLRAVCERNGFIVRRIDTRPDAYLSLACLLQVDK